MNRSFSGHKTKSTLTIWKETVKRNKGARKGSEKIMWRWKDQENRGLQWTGENTSK